MTWLVVLRRVPALRPSRVRPAPDRDPAVPRRHGPLRAGRPGRAGPAVVLAGRARHHDHRRRPGCCSSRASRAALPAAPVRPLPAALAGTVPSAAALDRLAYRTTIVAFPLYTFGVIAGAIWAEAAWGRFWGWDPKETVAFVAWVVYAAYLHARATAGWRSGRAAWINVAGSGGRALQPVLHQHGRRRPSLVRRDLTGRAICLAVRDHRPPSSPSTVRDDATTVGFRAEQRAGQDEHGHDGGPIVTESDPEYSDGPDPEYSDGSVGRYVREQWNADATARRSRRRASSTLSAPAAGREPQHATPAAGLEVVPPPVTDPAPGVSESRAAGPDIVRPDGAGSSVVSEAPAPRTQVPEARTAEHDVAARQAVTDPVTTRPPRAVTDPATTHGSRARRPPRTGSARRRRGASAAGSIPARWPRRRRSGRAAAW